MNIPPGTTDEELVEMTMNHPGIENLTNLSAVISILEEAGIITEEKWKKHLAAAKMKVRETASLQIRALSDGEN